MPTMFNYLDYPTGEIEIRLYTIRNTGTNDLKVDYYVAFPRPCLVIKAAGNMLPNGLSNFTLNGRTYILAYSGDAITFTNRILGDPIEFEPNKYNLIQSLMGDESNDPVITSTLTYSIYYSPRYLLI
jgi:hypothetical protein